MRVFRIVAALVAAAFLGQGQSPVFEALDSPVSRVPSVDAVGDLDNDGDFDLITPAGVLVNDGHGRFTPVAGAPLAFARIRTVIADLNGDALRDVISIAGTVVRIDMNGGGFSFGGPIGTIPGQSPSLIAVNLTVGDADLDGDPDILIGTMQQSGSTWSAGPPQLWLNDGAATFSFAPAAWFPSSPQAALALVTLSDLDSDGDLHAIMAGADLLTVGNIKVYANTGSGFVATQTIIAANVTAVELGNFDGDAYPDIAVSAITANGPEVGIVFNSPTGFGSFGATVFPSLADRLQGVDLDGDGIDELLEQPAAPAIGISVRHILPGGVLGPVTQAWPDLALIDAPGAEVIRDLDGDLDRDVLARTPTEVVELMNDSTGSLVRVGGHLDSVPITGRLRVGDVNGDGKPDLVGLGLPASLVTGINDGDGFFHGGPSTALSLPGSLVYYSFHVFDRDGDGDADIYAARNVASVYGGAPADVTFDAAGGSFVPSQAITGTGSTSVFRTADFDGDGLTDVILGRRAPLSTNNGVAGPTLFLKNLAPGGFAPPLAIGGNHATYDLEIADFDGDGRVDIFQTNANANAPTPVEECVLYLNSASGIVPIVQSGISGFYSASGDLNGDGLPDVVIDGFVLINAGAGAFNQGAPLPSALIAPAILVDVDADGVLDLVETPATVMRGLGGGVFASPEHYLAPVPISPTGWDIPESFVVDLDRDGDPDLVAPGPVVLMNVTRHVAHGSIPRPGRPASIELYGTPSGGWLLYGANGPAQIAVPPYGNVLIDPATAQLGAIGSFTSLSSTRPGTATLSVVLPTDPALVGWTSYWQALDAATLKATNRVIITVAGW